MSEQWALDAQEEEEARVEASKAAAAAKVDAEKKAARLKKRQETAARKRAKINSLEQRATPGMDDDRFGPGSSTPGLGQPSPLRHGTTYDAGEGSVDHSYSPAPTFMSNGDFQGGQSGYNSEMEQDNGEEHPYGGVHIETSSPTHVPRSPQGVYSWVDSSRTGGPGAAR